MRVVSCSPFSRSTVVRLIAVSCVIALAACQDVTAPDEVSAVSPSLRLDQSSAADELGQLSASLDDMTNWSLAALPDDQGHANIVGILNGLKGHLASGRISACQQDVTDARSFLGSLSENQQVELGGVDVALNVIQLALDKATQ